MADGQQSSIFGSGLDSNVADYSGGGADAQGAGPSNGADVTPGDATLPPNATPTQGQGLFGSGISTFGPPRYTSDPTAAPLDQAASLLEQRVSRASQVSSNPVAQLLNPEGVAAARQFVVQGTEQLQKVKQQQQQQADIQASARNFGMPADKVNPYMTNDTVDNWLLEKYKGGDFNAAKALKARGKGEWVTDYAADAMDGASRTMSAAQSAAQKLSAFSDNQAAYSAALKNLTPEERKALTDMGLQNIPTSASEWGKVVQEHGAVFAQHMQLLNTTRQKINNLTNFDQPLPKEVAAQLEGDIKIGSTNESAGFPVRGRSMDGQAGHIGPNGSVNIEKFGDTWNVASPERTKKNDEAFGDESVKGVLNQYTIANKFAHTVNDDKMYTSAAGLAMIKDELGGVGRDIAEKSAAAGSIGLSKMMAQQQGGFEGWMNRAQNEIGALKNWLDNGKRGPQPRLSGETKRGLQEVAKAQLDYTLSQAPRLSSAMRDAGSMGRKFDEIPLDKDLKETLRPEWEKGRLDTVNGFRAYPSLVRGNQRVFFPQGANVQGAQPAREPLQPSAEQPGNRPPSVGPGGSQGPTAPPAPTPQGGPSATPSGGGGGQPPTAPTGGPSPGRYGVPSGMALNTPQALDAAANRTIQIESGFKPGQQTGSYKGLGQWSDAEMKRHGITDPNDLEQTRTALKADIQTRAAKLQKDGLPVTAANVYLMHQQGEAGLEAHLRNPDGSAWQNVRKYYKSDAVAKQAIWGNMTPEMRRQFPDGVNSVTSGDFTRLWEARYNGTDNGKGANIAQAAGRREGLAVSGRTAPRAEDAGGLWSRVGELFAMSPEAQAAAAGGLTPEEARAAKDFAVEHAPAIGSTAGAIAGSAGGPFGTIGGGAAGGAAGQVIKDYVQGREQSPQRIAKEAALGGVLGIAPEGRPLLGAAARVVGAGGVEAGSKAVETGDIAPSDIAEAGAKGAAYALGGEALGRFISALGPASHKVLSNYLPNAQKEISAQAGKLAEARATLASEQPKLPGEGSGPNPKYEAAKKTEAEATQYIKDHGQNPDDMVYAYEQAKAGTSKGEAAVMRGANSEKTAVSQGYDELRTQAQETGVGAVKGNQPVPKGPLSMLRTAENPTGKVPEEFRAQAEHAEMLLKAPAPDWGAKWQQLQNAGSELIEQRMKFLATGDKPSAKAMDSLFEGVRNQQKAAAEYVFGAAKGEQVIAQLENLDQRYAKVMNATSGMNFQKMRGIMQGGNTPARRELEANFREFAKGDPSAIRAFNAMKSTDAATEAKLMIPVIAGEVAANLHGVPTLGAVSALVGGHRLYKLVQGYMNARLLDRTVTFKDFLAKEVRGGIAKLAGTAAQRGATMEGVQ